MPDDGSILSSNNFFTRTNFFRVNDIGINRHVNVSESENKALVCKEPFDIHDENFNHISGQI